MSMGEVIVPRSSVGMIIGAFWSEEQSKRAMSLVGKGGENIKRMALESGAKIQFKPDDPTQQERICTVHVRHFVVLFFTTAIFQGTIEAIQRATHMITQCVTKSNDGSQGGAGGGQEVKRHNSLSNVSISPFSSSTCTFPPQRPALSSVVVARRSSRSTSSQVRTWSCRAMRIPTHRWIQSLLKFK